MSFKYKALVENNVINSISNIRKFERTISFYVSTRGYGYIIDDKLKHVLFDVFVRYVFYKHLQ